MLLQEVFDVSVVAPEQLSFDGCAKALNENKKLNKNSRAVLLESTWFWYVGFIILDFWV
jgi:hypothetical protein